MHRSSFIWIAVLLLVGFGSVAHGGYDINFFVGQKMLDDTDWKPIEDQSELGLTTTFGKARWPVAIALDLLVSSDDTTSTETDGVTTASGDFSGRTIELDLGVRKIWSGRRTRPFVGAGIAFLRAELEFDGVVSTPIPGPLALVIDADGDATGIWAGGGVFWRLGRRFNLGLELRLSRGEVEILGQELEAGGTHLGLIVGWGD